ncbi:MAG TPA: phosphoadenylyl-sulfate reductase [Stellaceae bacterium]|nr:phosphoadenylyl-sulfate reductase [Stellaceae bacterium]
MDDGRAFAAMQAQVLAERYGELSGEALLGPLIEREFAGRIALVSSFGAEAALLLHMVATIDAATPVLFLDTQKHFPETLAYRDRLVAQLGLADVRSLTPDAQDVAERDRDGGLWLRSPDACCNLRKVEPLAKALAPFAAWISGRKRFHGGARAALPVIELDGRHIKINPLASWGAAQIKSEFEARGLPHHPMVADGFLSIGCMPCTTRPLRPDDPRSGRWSELEKTECGIHQSLLSSGL